MATARREASEPKGYFVRRLWAGRCLTWRTYTVPCKVGPSSRSEALPQTINNSNLKDLPCQPQVINARGACRGSNLHCFPIAQGQPIVCIRQ